MNKNKVKINIYNSEYSICSDEPAEYVIDLSNEIDERLNTIMKNNPRISVIQATVLLALEYADKSKKSDKGTDKLRAQIKDYLADASSARMEAELSKREADRLSRELENLRAKTSTTGNPNLRF